MGYQMKMEVRFLVFSFVGFTIYIFIWIETTGAYSYKHNAQEIFENFFGTKNPFATFGFESAPFSSKLNKPGPVKGKPVIFDLECTLKGKRDT